MHDDVCQVVVVQPGPAQLGLGQVEAERLDEVQARTGRRRESDGGARVPRDPRGEEHQVQHPWSLSPGFRTSVALMYVAADDRYDSMTYRRTGRSGLDLPALSLGLWHNFGHAHRYETQRATVLRAFDLGITHFDLANNYGPPPGAAEECFGRDPRRPTSARTATSWSISTKAGY